jgi:ribosomal protein S1
VTPLWSATRRKFPIGAEIRGTVEKVAPFGTFVSVEGVRPYGVVADVAGMRKEAADASVVIRPGEGDPVIGVVVGHSDHNEQLKIHLT